MGLLISVLFIGGILIYEQCKKASVQKYIRQQNQFRAFMLDTSDANKEDRK